MIPAEIKGAVVRSVVLTLLLEADGLADSAGWYLSVRGYCPGHGKAVRRDEIVALTWATIDHALNLIGHDDASRSWCARRRHRRAAETEG